MCKINEENPLLSVIIPVYNVEKYLNECVDSILNQKMKDFEIILVDDGSKDKSGEICDEYAEKYEYIRVIHKENGGASSARNRGIKEAKGEYLVFMDSDDFYINGDFFSDVHRIIEKYNPDGIRHAVRKLTEDGKNYKLMKELDEEKINNMSSYVEIVKWMFKNSSFTISACLLVIRRALVIKLGLYFKEGTTGEDIEWSLRLYRNELNLKAIENKYYVYRVDRTGSVSNTIKNRNLQNVFDIISKYADRFKNSDNEIEKIMLNYIAYQYVILCGLLVKAEDALFKGEMRKKLKKYKWLLDYRLFGKVKKVAFIGKIFGINVFCFVLGKYIEHG